jgi:hypothetical protein
MLRFMIPAHFRFAKRKSRVVILPLTCFFGVNRSAGETELEDDLVCTLVRYWGNHRGVRSLARVIAAAVSGDVAQMRQARAMLEGAQKL